MNAPLSLGGWRIFLFSYRKSILKKPLTQRQLNKAARRQKQREANPLRAQKMHLARVAHEQGNFVAGLKKGAQLEAAHLYFKQT